MADAITTYFALVKPDVGGSDNTWGEKINANFDTLDTTVKAVSDIANAALPSSGLLAGMLAVDGPGSGLNADLLDGLESTVFLLTANLLTAMLAVDGSGSGLDADLLDGQQATVFMLKASDLSDLASVPTARSNLALDEATNSDVWTGTDATKPITSNRLFGAAAPTALVSGASVSVDMATGFNFSLTLATNATLENPTNRKVGQSGVILVTQDGTGSRTLAYGSHWKFPGGAPVLSTGAGDVDLISYYVVSATFIAASLVNDLQ